MEDEPVKVREAKAEDLPLIVQFAVDLAKESESLSLDPEVVARGARGFLEGPQFGFYLVAERAGRVAGSVMVTYEYSDWRDGVYWWVQSVYVRPESRRRGVYRSLYRAVKERAARQGNVRGFRLYVARHNRLGRRVYRSLGMVESEFLVMMDDKPAPV